MSCLSVPGLRGSQFDVIRFVHHPYASSFLRNVNSWGLRVMSERVPHQYITTRLAHAERSTVRGVRGVRAVPPGAWYSAADSTSSRMTQLLATKDEQV